MRTFQTTRQTEEIIETQSNDHRGVSQELRRDVDLLGQALGDAIRALLGQDVFDLVEELRRAFIAAAPEGGPAAADDAREKIRGLAPDSIAAVMMCFTTYLRLVNEAEQIEIERVNRSRSQSDAIDRPHSIAAAVNALADEGRGVEEVCALLGNLDIQPTLTAHPTEARRRTTVELERRLGQAMRALRRPDATASERTAARRAVDALVRTLLSTDELPPLRRSVPDEVRLGIYFLSNSIWESVPRIHRDVREAMRARFGTAPDLGPFLRHRSWIGGDRDGNPNVTPQMTRWTFEEHRDLALKLHLEELEALRQELSASDRIVEIPQSMLDSIAADEQEQSLPDELAEQYRHEPFRTKLSHMIRNLVAARSGSTGYDADRFVSDLEVVYAAAEEVFGDPVAEGRLRDALVRARTFGFHLAAIDLRQHSAVHAAAVKEILEAAGEAGYGEAREEDRQAILARYIDPDEPLLGDRAGLSDETIRLLQTFDVAREAYDREPASVGAWIISMTHAPSAVLEVLFLARQTGLWVENDAAGHCPIDIVPLVETVHDLQSADALLRSLFSIDCYRAHLKARGDLQEVMLGYSDSNKDGGYWAANAALYDAQKRVAQVCREHDLGHRLFHGRGGTVGRGGGRANRAIFALPPQARNGRIRFTEQGEVISFRYANQALAHRHLEQITSATLLTVARPDEDQPPAGAEELLQRLGDAARKTYLDLIEDPGFWPWYREATPIAHISRLPIASRPASRARGELEFEDLRAIPWNFAWTQTRYCVPGWYGLQVADDDEDAPSREELIGLWNNWNYFRTVVENSELEMARARLPTARYYAELASEKPGKFHDQISAAFESSREILLELTGRSNLLENEPVISHSIELRNPYTDVLNLLQVELLRRYQVGSSWRGAPPRAPGDDPEPLGRMILLSLNGVAAAMQSTG